MVASYSVENATVISHTRISPHFMRVVFGGPGISRFGVDGPYLDQRLKIIFPTHDGHLPDAAELGDDTWYHTWRAIPLERRGHMRTYSVRESDSTEAGDTITVDFVMHDQADDEPGAPHGVAAPWALSAKNGNRVMIVGPVKGSDDGSGIEFKPGAYEHVVLAGDETAVPAICRILEDLAVAGSTLKGQAYLEVPEAADILDVTGPPGIAISWLPRHGKDIGSCFTSALLDDIAEHEVSHAAASPEVKETGDEELSDDEILWDTPSEEAVNNAASSGTYHWIAGESGAVTGLRRHLVRELNIPREQVCFMGYWKKGRSMAG